MTRGAKSQEYIYMMFGDSKGFNDISNIIKDIFKICLNEVLPSFWKSSNT